MESSTLVKNSGNLEKQSLLTTSRLATDLLQFARFICHEESSSCLLVERALGLFFFKNKSRFNTEIKLSDFNPNQYIFKRNDFFFLIQKITFFFKRDFLFRLKVTPQSPFEKLNWREKVVLVLTYKYKLSANDISYLLDLTKAQYIETLYAAKITLGIDFEEDSKKETQLSFNQNDNNFFYQKNLEIYSTLSLGSTEAQAKAINQSIPRYGISIDDHKRINQLILKSLKEINSK